MLRQHATRRALVVSPAATESAGFYMSTQQIAELVVEFVQLAPSAVVVTVSALLIITNQPVATSVVRPGSPAAMVSALP